MIVAPPAGWRPSAPFIETLLAGLTDNSALTPVTLAQYFAEVPAGGNREPAVRHLQSGPAGRKVLSTAAHKYRGGPRTAESFADAIRGHPPEVARLGDQLLGPSPVR